MSQYPLDPANYLRLDSFARRLRLLSAVGIAGVGAGVFGEAFLGSWGAHVPAAMAGGQVLTLPLVWVPLASLLAVAAWTYLLVGALHAPLLLRLVVAMAWGVLAWPLVKISPLWVAPGYASPLLLLFWRRWARPLLDFGLWESLVFGALTLAAFLAAAVASLMKPTLPLLSYNAALSSQFVVFAIVATPLLILSGTDLAEIASKAGAWATGRVQNWAYRRLAWLLLALSLVQSAYLFVGTQRLTPGMGLTVLWTVGILYAGRWLPEGKGLAEPPFPLLISMMTLVFIAPIGGTLLLSVLPQGVVTWIPWADFLGSALLAAGAALLLRRWLDRRWPGTWVALLVGAVWMAWLVAGGQHHDWAPTSRGIDVAIAAGTGLLGVRALRRPLASARPLLLGLEALAVFTAINAIQAGYSSNLDPGDIFAAVQALLMVGYVVWLGLARHRFRLFWAAGLSLTVLAAVALFLRHPDWFGGWQAYIHVGLMAVALIWGIVVAHRRMGELLGEGVTEIHQTFLLIGFSLMVVAVLGWNRALTPAPDSLTDFGPLTSFGLTAVGTPLYLLSVAQRLHRSEVSG